MVYAFLNKEPDFPESVFVAPSADLIGDVTIGEESSVWFNVTIRGDVNWIKVGDRSNIQDNTCIHVMNRTGPTEIGNEVTIGHNAMIHGCTIHDRVLIGIHATVLDEAIIETEVMVAAGSLVPPGKRLESGYLYMGSPVEKKRELSDEEIASTKEHSDHYVKYARVYMQKDTYETNPFYDAES